MKIKKYTIVDVFTNKPLEEGNPLAVFTVGEEMDDVVMQRIAKEMNLSETTFIFPARNGGDAYVRIFTPVNELPFAGHPILGTAFVLGESLTLKEIKLETAMGLIPLRFERMKDNRILSVHMDQPIPTHQVYEHQELLLNGLGLNESTLPVEVYCNGPRHVFVGLPSIVELSKINPDLRVLAKLENVAVNCFAKDKNSWRMRMFSPAYGVAEDAATGSAAGPLVLHLIRHGLASFEEKIEICQGVEIGRRSIMYAIISGSLEKIRSITVSGSAVTVARGEFLY